jgi:hypothetical protein
MALEVLLKGSIYFHAMNKETYETVIPSGLGAWHLMVSFFI